MTGSSYGSMVSAARLRSRCLNRPRPSLGRDLPEPSVEIVRRPEGLRTFEVLPRQWVIERTLAWISSYRRCARGYERLPASHEATVYWAMITVMTRPASPERDPGRSGAGRLGPGCHTTGDGSTARTRQLGVLHWGGGAAAVLDVAPEYEFIVVGAGTAGVCWRPGCHRTPEPGCWCWRRGSKR